MQFVDGLAPYRSGSTEPWTVNIIIALLHAKRAKRVLELGTYEGLTTMELARATEAHGGIVTTVEIDPMRTAIAKQRCLDAGVTNVKFVTQDTETFLQQSLPGSYDFAFVDDDHNAEHVARELAFLYDWQGNGVMAPGSLICVHDVIGHFNLSGVVQGHHGYVIELPLLHAAGGLGIIQIPGPLRDSQMNHVEVHSR